MFSGNGGLLGFIIGDPKHLEGPRIPSGSGGFEPPPYGFNSCSIKILSTFLGISICTLTSYVRLGVWGLNFISTTIWVGIVTNGTSITITID